MNFANRTIWTATSPPLTLSLSKGRAGCRCGMGRTDGVI